MKLKSGLYDKLLPHFCYLLAHLIAITNKAIFCEGHIVPYGLDMYPDLDSLRCFSVSFDRYLLGQSPQSIQYRICL